MDHRIHQVPPQHALQLPTTKKHVNSNTNDLSFKDILGQQQKLKISKHASERLNERNININESQWKLIENKMKEAKQKGITDSLVLMNEAALLVSTKNNTVVTAMNMDEATNKIFTNINGTILIKE